MAKYFIGTAGWSYDDWVPSFYPKKQSSSFDWLNFYSHYFNCVEVNSTHYSYINSKVVHGWINKVTDSPDFNFVVKLHQDFTHKRNYTNKNSKEMQYNLDILAKAERLGGVLIQFPYSFVFSDATAEYIRKLGEVFQFYNCFLEVRHNSWNNKDALDLCREQNMILCTIDQPQVGKSVPFEPIVIGDKAYIRFHGRNAEAWINSIQNFGREQSYSQQNERYKYLYSPGELVEIYQKIKTIEEKAKKIYIILNNHPVGYAAVNAFELIHYLEQKPKIDIPKNMIEIFPRLKLIASQ